MSQMKPERVTRKLSPIPEKKSVFNVMNWEVRPGGMLVQKRNSDSNQSSVSVHTISVRVNYGSFDYEFNINPQASFGELKKMISETTGLHSEDQKLLFKGKEKDSKSYLDVSGVKNWSKLVLIEDILRKEKRVLELRKSASMDKISKAIAEISIEVDKLIDQVSVLDLKICRGGKVAERDLEILIELLMTQVIKLDEITVDGDLKSKRKFQVRRVQKYIETLDKLKIKVTNLDQNGNPNSTPQQNVQQKQSNGNHLVPMQQHQDYKKQFHFNAKKQLFDQNQHSKKCGSTPVVTTNWEIFDSGVELIQIPAKSNLIHSNMINPNSKLNWELFD